MTILTLTPQNIIHIAFASVSLLGIILVLGKPQFKGLVLLLATHFLQQSFNLVEDLDVFPPDFVITPAFMLAFGPLYYLFVKNILYGRLSLSREVIHLCPFFIGLFLTHWWWQELAFGFVVLLVYLAFAFKLLRRYERFAAELTSAGEQFDFRWIAVIFAVICITEIIGYARLVLQPFLDMQILLPWYYVDLITALLYVSYLIVKAVRQPELYTGLGELEVIEEKKQKIKEQQSNKAQAEELFATVDHYQTSSQRFLQPKYSLRDLAEELDLSEQLVSWVINSGGGLSFSDYINGKRLDQLVAAMHASDGTFNILHNAMTVGFSSKSSFNTAFRRRFGTTPREYLKTL